MSDARTVQQKNLQDGMKAVSGTEGQGEPKIGVDEFISIAERFGFSPGAIAEIRAVVEREPIGAGPFLANYYSGLPESKVEAYQRTAKAVFGADYAIGTSSGTGALHAAFVAAGVGPGTEVICPAIGFVATAAAVVIAKGVPVFCDVDRSLGIDPDKIEALVTKRTVAIAPTHVMGSVCNMEAIMKIARKHGLAVIEDAAQSSGGKFHGKHVGTIGDLGAFSISAYKISGGGEGGLLLTSDLRLWERASQVVETGGLWRPDRFAGPRYEGEIFVGTNYRMSELEAAVDVVQLGKLDATADRFRKAKLSILKRLRTYREIVPQLLNDAEGEVGYLLRFYPHTHAQSARIVAALNERGLEAGTRGPDAGPDWHLASQMYPIILRSGATEVCCPFECPVYLERGGKAVYESDDCPVANDLFDRMVSVKLNQWYTAEQCSTAATVLNEVLSECCTEDSKATPWL